MVPTIQKLDPNLDCSNVALKSLSVVCAVVFMILVHIMVIIIDKIYDKIYNNKK